MIWFIVAIISLIALYLVIKLIPYTPSIHGENAIASLEKINIGGIKQSILIRSSDANNPILLYLHSGPGSTEMVSFRTYNKELEKHFTVVIWEQRGTGKSYSKDIKDNSMTIDQLVDDTGELMEYLLKRFHKDKLFLVGHSWGTALGILTASKFPGYLYAYAGSGQVVEPAYAEKLSWDYTLARASENNNTKAMKELNNINSSFPYLDVRNNPEWYKDLKTERKWLVRFGGETYKKDNTNFLIIPSLGLSEYTLIDFINFARGSEFSLKTLWPQIMEINFIKTNTEIEVPILFLQGRHDYNTPASLVEDYFNAIKAPGKKLIWFEKSGHHPMYEEHELYDKILIEELLKYSN